MKGSCNVCGEEGRLLAKLGNTCLIYCPKHRKYGQEVIQTFLEDIFNYKKSKLFEIAKQEFFFGGEKILDEKNEETLGSWISKEIFRKHLEEVGSSYLKLSKYEIRIDNGTDEGEDTRTTDSE